MTAATHARNSIVLGTVAVVTACGRIGFDPLAGTPNTGPDAPTDTVACQFGPWTTPAGDQQFGNVNRPNDTEWGVEISRDGLRLVFSSDRPYPPQTPGEYDLYMAERRSSSDPFDPPVRLSISSDDKSDHEPSLSPDALELYFVSDLDPWPCIYVSRRADSTASWGLPRRLDALCPVDEGLGGTFLSGDGLRLYYDVSVSGDDSVLMASRADRTTDFTAKGREVGLSDVRYCALDDRELTVYCESLVGGRAQLWQSTRSSTAAAFPPGALIQELADDMSSNGDPSVTGDGLRLVYASNRASPNRSSDVYIAERTCE